LDEDGDEEAEEEESYRQAVGEEASRSSEEDAPEASSSGDSGDRGWHRSDSSSSDGRHHRGFGWCRCGWNFGSRWRSFTIEATEDRSEEAVHAEEGKRRLLLVQRARSDEGDQETRDLQQDLQVLDSRQEHLRLCLRRQEPQDLEVGTIRHDYSESRP
jgi:hypothetical protein